MCDFKQCHKVLKNAKLNTFFSNKSRSLQWNLLQWLEKTTYEEIKHLKDSGFSFGVTIPIYNVPIPFNLDADFSEEEYKNLQEFIRQGKIETLAISSLDQFILQFESPEVYKAWSNCITAMINSCQRGLYHSVEVNEQDIIITIGYTPINNTDPYPIIDNLYTSDNFECKTGCFSKGFQLNNEHVIVVRKKNEESGTIVIDTDKGTVTVPVQSKPAPPPTPPTPPTPPPIEITEEEKKLVVMALKLHIEENYKKILEQNHKSFDPVPDGFLFANISHSGHCFPKVEHTIVKIQVDRFETNNTIISFEVSLNSEKETLCIRNRLPPGPSRSNSSQRRVISKLFDLNKKETFEKQNVNFDLNGVTEYFSIDNFSVSLEDISNLILQIVN
ncbi:hypothetical protein [Bacillus wiedmannii]|uniref:hypothetical protein n=1 Tax=Bacillus wiedmannii TaxID=1890302 RepID=UPI000D172F52|nr:hypothetical protein [Bacillus wiedmannii]PTC10763.1 hypothetical protein C6557_27725 [Bacillus wiedmannii]